MIFVQMSQRPFDSFGGEFKTENELNDIEKEERRLCGIGPSSLLGQQFILLNS